MVDCKRCCTCLHFDNGKCFDGAGRVHNALHCNTIPNHVWCPIHRESFSHRMPCDHYARYGYVPGQNEGFFINLINQNYSKGDWFARRHKTKKSGDSMKRSTCTKCNAPVHNMSKRQQLLHEKAHAQEKNHNTISEFF